MKNDIFRNPKDYAEALRIIEDYRDLCEFFETEIEDLNNKLHYAELKYENLKFSSRLAKG